MIFPSLFLDCFKKRPGNIRAYAENPLFGLSASLRFSPALLPLGHSPFGDQSLRIFKSIRETTVLVLSGILMVFFALVPLDGNLANFIFIPSDLPYAFGSSEKITGHFISDKRLGQPVGTVPTQDTDRELRLQAVRPGS